MIESPTELSILEAVSSRRLAEQIKKDQVSRVGELLPSFRGRLAAFMAQRVLGPDLPSGYIYDIFLKQFAGGTDLYLDQNSGNNYYSQGYKIESEIPTDTGSVKVESSSSAFPVEDLGQDKLLDLIQFDFAVPEYRDSQGLSENFRLGRLVKIQSLRGSSIVSERNPDMEDLGRYNQVLKALQTPRAIHRPSRPYLIPS